ncbi:hypothetical protein KIN20_037436 [Parelaphostrongylus tenuis]|uniref:Uncharacterized protein n=1 Tax=Parelaphostrongylus tenuis TaxID=148309 RepID=A0AAD5RC20_PARTN|nr:hypothetical protein KIN20_011506 [Parelaphostrongylus tenuis]KAJ1373291.1 hypothetical protein KIN20_035652 [Parelaphostrongylus tenuis]KAJ1374689.1 hypothetical protein KIN20_037436 [Parelaphostrongylus tenuis]
MYANYLLPAFLFTCAPLFSQNETPLSQQLIETVRYVNGNKGGGEYAMVMGNQFLERIQRLHMYVQLFIHPFQECVVE